MELIIELPDDRLTEEIIKKGNWEEGSLFDMVLKSALKEAIILPKGHGRLIDADAFIAKVNKDRAHSCYIESWTADDVLDRLQQNYAPTIIEADKAESEDKNHE